MTTKQSGYKHYAGLEGSKVITCGADTDIYNTNDIQSALDLVATGGTVWVEPGTYTLTAYLDWHKPCTIMSLSDTAEVVITSALTTRTCKLNMPATGTAAATYFRAVNIKFDNSSSGNGLDIDNNGGLAQSQYIQLRGCSFTSTSGNGISHAQTTSTQAQYITITGNPWINDMAASTIALTKAASVFTIFGMNLTGALTIGTTAVASILNVQHCFYYSQAQTAGGGAGQLHNMIGNTYFTAGVGGSAATGGLSSDFDATCTLFFATHAITPT